MFSVRLVNRKFATSLLILLVSINFLACDLSVNASELSSQELIALMIANDRQLDRVLVRCTFTRLTKPRPVMSPLRFQQHEERRPGRQKVLVPQVKHDDSIAPSQLPEAGQLFKFANKHFQEIKAGKIDRSSDLTDSEAELLKLLIEKRVSVTMQLKVTEEPELPPQPAPHLIAIRGRDVIVIHDPLREVELTHKYSSIAGILNSTTMESTGRNGSLEWMVFSVPSTSKFDSAQMNALWHMFAMGVGFGSRLKEMTILKVEDGLAHCDASLEIWPGRLNKSRLVIDSDQIVRRADIECQGTTITIENQAIKRFSPTFHAATAGHFRWAIKKDSQYSELEFRLAVTSIELEQSDEQFDALEKSVPPAGEKITRVRHAQQ